MKGIVVDKNKNYIVIMSVDGTFQRIKSSENIELGQEIIIPDKKTFFFGALYKYTGLAAAMVIMLTLGINVKAYYTPYGYLNIDINPSIQLEFNKFDRVMNATALNTDGSKVLSKIEKIKNLKVEDAVEAIVDTACYENYIKNDVQNDIMVSLYTPDSTKKDILQQKIANSVDNRTKLKNKFVQVLNEDVTKGDIEEARSENVSVGKLILYKRAQGENLDISLEDLKSKPVREIVKLINDKKQENKKIQQESKREEKDAEKPKNPEEPKIEDNIKKPSLDSQSISKPKIIQPNKPSEKINDTNNKNSTKEKIEGFKLDANTKKLIDIPKVEIKKPQNIDEKDKDVVEKIKTIEERQKNINKIFKKD